MVLPDVNMLLYGFRKDTPLREISSAGWGMWSTATQHSASRRFRSRLWFEWRRIHGRSHSRRRGVGAGFCDNLLSQPHCEIFEPGPRHWIIFKRLSIEAIIRGAMTSDDWYAALAIERGCVFGTFAPDFARFASLDWRVPEPR